VSWRRGLAWALLAGSGAGAGCGAGQTSPEEIFREESTPGSMARIEVFLRHKNPHKGTPVVVGATEDALIGVPLEGGSPWRFAHEIQTRPEVTGGVVVGIGGGEVFALKAATGALLWARPSGGMALLGAGDDGDMTAVTLKSVTGRRSVVLVMGRDGQVLRQLETEQSLGRPATLLGLTFIPWGDRHVTAFDVLLGREIGRLTIRRGMTHAVQDDGALFFGGRALLRLDEQLALWPADQLPRAEIHELQLVASPRMLPRLEDARPLFAGLPDRVRIYARPTRPGAPLGLLGGRYFLAYHQAIVARRSDGDFPVWARLLERPPVGGDVYRGGLALCDEKGHVLLLGENRGAVEATLELGAPVRSCVVHGAGLERSEGGSAGNSLPEQLAEVLRAPASALAPLQREVLGTLGRMGDAGTTQVLLDLAIDPRTPAIWIDDLYALIEGRHNGVEAMMEALRRPSRGEERPPPVAPLARALGALREHRAAASLLDHLESPATPAANRLALALALQELASAAELPRLRSRFEQLRRESSEPDQQAAVALARALLRLDGAAGHALVTRAAADPQTPAALRGELTALVAPGKKR
jgi:outer membrane protein assembly factor BamB